MESQWDQPPVISKATFTVAHQKVELEVNFNQEVSGRAEITIYPDSSDLKEISLHGRQCTIKKVLVNDIPPSSVQHEDPCEQLTLHTNGTVHQHHLLAEKVARSVGAEPEPDIVITLPKKIRIVPVEVAEVHTQAAGTITITDPQTQGASATEVTQALADTTAAKFTPLTVIIEFESSHAREILHISSGRIGSGRWPHAYTRSKLASGGASSLFPCVDKISSRCTWDISIKCPRTVGDAIQQALSSDPARPGQHTPTNTASRQGYEAKEMVVICSGELTDDILDRHDSTLKTVSFSCSQQLAPQQIGFAIGPFEKVNLNELRDAHQTEELGRNAVDMLAYCLPGRAEETKNTCLPTTMAMDYVVQSYISSPVRSYAVCFVEDAPPDTSIFAGLTVCSSRLLYPEAVIDSAQEVTRTLVHAIVSQWIGVNVIATVPQDNWIIIGGAHFITNLFMRELSGNNEYRAYVKQQADRVVELDYGRPSIYDLGALLHVDPSAYEFLAIKAPVVLFILDRRIAKREGTSKMPGIFGKILLKARTGDLDNNTLSTETFQRFTERIGHEKIEDFLGQWVKGAGCPRFFARQRFNKKKLVVEMTIQQEQNDRHATRDLDPDFFMREVHEDFHAVYEGQSQAVFTGPMTIRIHEADGTPYEHIVQIKDLSTTFEVPYNTKYKRLKRSKKQRARASTKAAAEQADEENDALVYCLGDVLQTEEEIAKWRIQEWTQEEEDKMNMESYEWIRLDADFEWICTVNLAMPGYMYVSQLQQDRDVVAHLESIRTISRFPPHPTMSSIIIRTLMDRRYFHGVRALAAKALVRHAAEVVNNVGLFHLKTAFEELYCVTDRGSTMTRPNDFSDQLSYMVQCEILEAIANVRNGRGHAPREVRDFLLDKLKFNDNSMNDYSDAHYIARLMKALTGAAIARPHYTEREVIGDYDLEDEVHELKQFESHLLEEIDRYRRMDEWTSSFQNLYSRTAMECQAMLAAVGIGQYSPLHFLQYTRPGNYDMLRQTAYTILVTPKIFEDPAILRYSLYCMVADPSPYIRHSLQRAFGIVLGRRAIGDNSTITRPAAAEGLVIEGASIEEEDLASKRAQELARRQNLDAAVKALKGELGGNQALQSALWNAICYDQITLEDVQTLLDYCRLLYDPVDEMKVSLRLPRYWKVQSLGKGKLKFSESRKVRSKPVPKWQPPVPVVAAPAALPPVPVAAQAQAPRPGPKLKLNFGTLKQNVSGPNRQPSISLSNPSPTPPPPPPVPQRKPSVPVVPQHQQSAQIPQTPIAEPQRRITLKIPKRPSQIGPSS
ncbi:Transcription initiation factor TFIID subunit 2 [Cladophialophora chaetospira]|uniref:Transcription initiation factor TFIID subunit 2 n=1 Tax=Cladophialophora chaetospira TaxID=386627 RepID=A0AA39CIQ4_9EURO|nr:Transcription initiation factor TFIID subunit 2 [Cladophialophora chaetospira]